MNDSKHTTQSSGREIDRRSFMGAAGAASFTQISSVKEFLANSKAQTETHFIEAALEFDVLTDRVAPARKEGPYAYNAVRNKNAFLALNRIEPKDFGKLVTAATVTFGLKSFKTGDATFVRDGLDILPVVSSDTPRVTRYYRLDQWNGAPTYTVRSTGNDAAIAETANKKIEIKEDTAQRIELDEQEISSDQIPGINFNLQVVPHLEVRNYGQMEVHDARKNAWKR